MTGQRAIATPHHLATEAGEAMFTAGGNAVDAALAAAAVLTVVYPHNTSIGGDVIALVGQDGREPTLINAFGYAPAAVDPSGWGTDGRVDSRGPHSITLPGALKGWQHLHDTYGSLDLRTILTPAVEHAQGYDIGRSVHHNIGTVSALSDEGRALMERLFGPDFDVATRASNPALGATLTHLAEVGLDDFYHGELAARSLSFLRSIRPDFAAEDFADYAVIVEEPLTETFAGHRVFTGGAPCQGFQLIRLLRDLRASVGSEDPSALSDESLAEIWLASFTASDDIRDSVLADGVPASVLLNPATSGLPHAPSPAANGDTIGIAASDEHLQISLIQSLYSSFGSLCHDPETGIIYQCRGAMFSLDPESPQHVTGRARPPHTLMPVLVTDESNAPVFVQSAMGGKAQAQIHSRILIDLLRGERPEHAVSQPRWVTGVDAQGDPVRTVTAEEDVPEPLRSIVFRGAEATRSTPPVSDGMGHANVIDLRGEVPLAAADPRSDGSAWVG